MRFSRHGSTLAGVLVFAGLALMLTGAVAALTRGSARQVESIDERTSAAQGGQLLLARLRSDLGRAVLDELHPIRIGAEGRELSFHVRDATGEEGDGSARAISYRFEPAAGQVLVEDQPLTGVRVRELTFRLEAGTVKLTFVSCGGRPGPGPRPEKRVSDLRLCTEFRLPVRDLRTRFLRYQPLEAS